MGAKSGFGNGTRVGGMVVLFGQSGTEIGFVVPPPAADSHNNCECPHRQQKALF